MADRDLKKRRPTSDDRRPFLNVPWSQQQERDFEEWLKAQGSTKTVDKLLDELSDLKLGLKFTFYEGSWCATIENTKIRQGDDPYLLSGWSDTWRDALLVAYFKLFVLLGGDWNHPFAGMEKSRRR